MVEEDINIETATIDPEIDHRVDLQTPAYWKNRGKHFKERKVFG